MSKKRIKLWTDALLSGKHSQTQGRLKGKSVEGSKHKIGLCCLGVACEVYRQETKRGRWNINEEGQRAFILKYTESELEKYGYEGNEGTRIKKNIIRATGTLPEIVRHWFGIKAGDTDCLVDLNDHSYNLEKFDKDGKVIPLLNIKIEAISNPITFVEIAEVIKRL